MVIDIIFIFIIIFGIFRGISKGLVVGIFSLLAFIIGLAAALKLSVVVAGYLQKSVISATKWVPVLSFLIVFFLVILLIGLGARLIKKSLQFALLGWLDSLGGIILYVALYIFIFSIFLFYADKVLLITPSVVENSKTYPYIVPWGPKIIDNFGKIIPVFKNMFAELEAFFAGLASKTSQ